MQTSLQDINQLEWLNATYGAAYYTSMHSIITDIDVENPTCVAAFYPLQQYKIQQSTNTGQYIIDKIIDISTWQLSSFDQLYYHYIIVRVFNNIIMKCFITYDKNVQEPAIFPKLRTYILHVWR